MGNLKVGVQSPTTTPNKDLETTMIESLVRIKRLPTGWIEQPTSPLRVARSTTELNGHIAGVEKPFEFSMRPDTSMRLLR